MIFLFLDVIQAIEGKSTFFNCSLEHEDTSQGECLIEKVMIQSEEKMKDELNNTFIIDIARQIEASNQS